MIKTPKYNITLISGLFTWSGHLQMGKGVGATPNGRKANEGISHGANPSPGFREDGAITALSIAVSKVQCGYGNCSPLQLDLDISIAKEENATELVCDLLKTHFEMGGTQINLNIADKEALKDACKHPEKYPDLIVRVTGFSAYFGSLSQEMRESIVERTISSA
jgi:formate C-acetyltransferase